MKELLKNKLIHDLSYSAASASITAEDHSKIQFIDLKNALKNWIQTNTQTLITTGDYSTESLMDNYHMTYPAALIFLNWLRVDPTAAISVLKMRM